MTTPIKISFSYPRRGLFGDFATFRLGSGAAEKHPPGTAVELIDSRSKRTIKLAIVTAVYVGTLSDMATQHAHMAHNWKESPPGQRNALLVASMKKRYPPGRCSDNSICTVIYLKETP